MIADKPLFTDLPAQGNILDEQSVHSLRKETKQLRARLQMLRQLEGQQQDTEHLRQSVKELARMLAGQRDADVMHGLLQELIAENPEPEIRSLLTAICNSLGREHMQTSDLDKIGKLVDDIRQNTRRIERNKHPETDIIRVLDTRLASLCAAGPALLAAADWEALHDWRKQVKKLLYQYDLKPVLSDADLFIYEHLDSLGSELGGINDLTMLEQYVRDKERDYTRVHDVLTFERLYALIENHRQTRLENCRTLFSAIQNRS